MQRPNVVTVLVCSLLACCATSATEELQPYQATDGSVEAAVDVTSKSGASQQLNDLFAWAIENSDPNELSKQAGESQHDKTSESFLARKIEIQKILEQIRNQPSEKELMEEALKIAKNSSEPTQQREAALTALRYLVEPIDSANVFPGLGGLQTLFGIIDNAEEPEVHTAAAYILGTAASNNQKFQEEVLKSKTAIQSLLKIAASDVAVVSEKALYAIGVLIRNSHDGQHQFYLSKGVRVLAKILANAPSHSQLRKTLNLITDLTDVHGEVEGQHQFANKVLVKSLLELLQHPDDEIQEGALLALISLAASPEPRRSMKTLGAPAAVREAEKRVQQLLVDADEEHKEILDYLTVLLGDFEELLSQKEAGSERTEL